MFKQVAFIVGGGILGMIGVLFYMWCIVSFFTAFPWTIPVLIVGYFSLAIYFKHNEPLNIEDNIEVHEISKKG